MVRDLIDSPEQLLEIMPQGAKMNRMLFDFLASSQNYDLAFELQAKMRQGLPAGQDNDFEAAAAWRDWHGRQIQLLADCQWGKRSEMMPEYLRLAVVSVASPAPL